MTTRIESASLSWYPLRIALLDIEGEWSMSVKPTGHVRIAHSQGSDLFSPFERITANGAVIYEPPAQYQGRKNEL